MNTDLYEDSEWIEGCGVEFVGEEDGHYWLTWMTPAGFGFDGPFGPFPTRAEAFQDATAKITERLAIYDQGKIMSGEQSFDD